MHPINFGAAALPGWGCVQVSFEKFTSNAIINEADKNLETIEEAFVEKFSKPEEPQEFTSKPTLGVPVLGDLSALMDRLDCL